MEHMAYKERLVALGVCSLARSRLRENLIVAYNYFKGSCKDDKANFFFLVVGDGISKGSNHKLQVGRFSSGHLETGRVVLHWENSTALEQVIRETGASPSLEVCKGPGFNNQLLLNCPRLPVTV